MKRLIYRLSSIGDIVLSQASLAVPFNGTTDWVTHREFEVLFSGHPQIRKLWTFSRRENGFIGWLKLNLRFVDEGYDEVLDLHSTLRTKSAKWFFFLVCLYRGVPFPRWKALKKRRWRRIGYLIFKAAWPSDWRPIHLQKSSAKLAGGNGTEKTDLRHLVGSEPEFLHVNPVSDPFYVVMPSAAWPGKQWSVNSYFEFILKHPLKRPVIVGTEKDEASKNLVGWLRAKEIPHINAVGKLDLKQMAWLLSHAKFLISNDTGMAHLSEAVGTPAVVLYGPTTPEFGFGITHAQSRALHSDIWCSPCSKDGTFCYRMTNRFACLKGITPAKAIEASKETYDE